MSALRDWSPGFLYEIQPPPFPMRKLRVYFPTAQEIQWKSRSRIDSEVSTVVPAHEFPGLVLYPVQSKTPSCLPYRHIILASFLTLLQLSWIHPL